MLREGLARQTQEGTLASRKTLRFRKSGKTVIQKSTEHANREIWPTNSLTKVLTENAHESVHEKCPRKCPRRLRLFLCKAQQRVPTKTPTRVLTGKFPVLTGNFPVLTKMYTKVSSVNFHMSYFHMFCFLASDFKSAPLKSAGISSWLSAIFFAKPVATSAICTSLGASTWQVSLVRNFFGFPG